MQLLAVAPFEALLAGAQRNGPVRAHLHAVVAGLKRFVVERVSFGARIARRPDQRLVRIGEAPPAKIRHRIRLAPHDVVENPEAQVLQDRADAKNVMIRADHPQRRLTLHHAPARDEPSAREVVVGDKARELVPVVVDCIDARVVGTLEVALQLQVIGGIGENEIDRFRRQLCHLGNAVADQNSVGCDGLETDAGRPSGRPATRCNHDSEL
jgi:hypothetical protein